MDGRSPAPASRFAHANGFRAQRRINSRASRPQPAARDRWRRSTSGPGQLCPIAAQGQHLLIGASASSIRAEGVVIREQRRPSSRRREARRRFAAATVAVMQGSPMPATIATSSARGGHLIRGADRTKDDARESRHRDSRDPANAQLLRDVRTAQRRFTRPGLYRARQNTELADVFGTAHVLVALRPGIRAERLTTPSATMWSCVRYSGSAVNRSAVFQGHVPVEYRARAPFQSGGAGAGGKLPASAGSGDLVIRG